MFKAEEKAHAEPFSQKEFDVLKAKKPAWLDLRSKKTPKVDLWTPF